MSSLQTRHEVAKDLSQVPDLAMVHGITMGLAFVVLFPTGAVLIRALSIKQTMWIHASCQILGLLLMLGGFATGMRLGNILDETSSNFHTIVGTAIVVGMLLMPWFGYWHHKRYRVLRKKTAWTYTHVWFGRVLMLLGIANGGLGFSLAYGDVGYSRTGMIVYAAFAGVSGIVLIGLMIHHTVRDKRPKAEQYPMQHHGQRH